MGGIMSHPLNAVHIQRRKSGDFSVGCASLQGWRPEHEDSHVMSPSFGSTGGVALFGVCDGHAGSRAAAFTARRLPQLLAKADMSKDESLTAAFLGCDAEYRKEPGNSDGCTAVFCHVQRISAKEPDAVTYALTVMNLGDSRCLLIRPGAVSADVCRDLTSGGRPGEGCGLLFETVDHKPDSEGEKRRIEAAGGFVSQDDPPRLDGVIAVSRVIGDFAYKSDDSLSAEKQKMSAVPEISRLEAREGDVLVVACDGLFEGMKSEELARQIILRMHTNYDLGIVAKETALHALNATESKDNMTLMIVLLGREGEEDLVEEELAVGEYESHPEQRDKYETFFRKSGFPSTPSPCEVCKRVLKHMSQCPCRSAVYCGVQCQRTAWRDHKKKCIAHKQKQ